MISRRKIRRGVAVAAVLAVVAGICGQAWSEAPPSPASLDRARREVRLLDDIYKGAIVLITKHYVDEKSDLAAGEAFKLLFQSMDEKGWHEVRLIDATGDPLNSENAPADDFEKEAIKALAAGKPSPEKVETRDGVEFFRVATPIPLVMDRCTLCHENYKDKKLVGALGYRLPLQPHR